MTFKEMIIMFNENDEEYYYYNIKGCSHGLQKRTQAKFELALRTL